jgi:hypothetical protein
MDTSRKKNFVTGLDDMPYLSLPSFLPFSLGG